MSKHILIIGNSDGIGKALTTLLITRGDWVTGLSRSPLTQTGPRHAQFTFDLRDMGFYAHLVEILHKSSPVDSLVYCAGAGDVFDAVGVDRDSDIIRVNLAALADAVRAVLPAMSARASGSIVGVSSIGDFASAAAPSYGASKAGVTAYLRGLRRPLRTKGVRVCVVRFGFVDTKMAKARQRPFLISAERAAPVLLHVLDHGPTVKTYPWGMHMLATLFG